VVGNPALLVAVFADDDERSAGLVGGVDRDVELRDKLVVVDERQNHVGHGEGDAGAAAVAGAVVFVEIYNTAPHAPFIEYGVRAANVKPGTAMITALVKWVKRHGMASDDQEATVIAWKIVKSMQKRGIFNRGGTSGLGILKKALLKLDWIQEEVDREIEKEF